MRLSTCLRAALPLLISLAACTESERVVRLKLSLSDESTPDGGTVAVVGLTDDVLVHLRKQPLSQEQWRKIFAVFVGDTYPSNLADKPPILGSFEVGRAAVYFRPRFSFREDLTHYARLNLAELHTLLGLEANTDNAIVEATFAGRSEVSIPTTRVVEIFPTAHELPTNLLRLYVHFSAPMSQRDVQKYVHLFDLQGNEVPLPFVEVKEGLWDHNRQRLTLFFHPGRIKRGVAPNLAMGTPLQEGQMYHLIVDQDWQDASGHPLVASFEKSFTVVAEDREPVDYRAWVVHSPASLKQPVTVEFPQPLDRALLERMISVRGAAGKEVKGRIEILDSERTWRFSPDGAWQTGFYGLMINTSLEDLAGNNLRAIFDREVASQPTEPETPRFIEIKFEVKGKSQT